MAENKAQRQRGGGRTGAAQRGCLRLRSQNGSPAPALTNPMSPMGPQLASSGGSSCSPQCCLCLSSRLPTAPDCLSSHLLPVIPQLWLSQASSSWPIQRTSRLWWYPAQLGTVRGWGCAPCALEEEIPCPREGSSLGQHHQPGALCWWDASQGHGWLGTGNSPAAWAKLGGSNGEKSGGCLIPPPQPCKSSPHSLVQEIASQAATILRPV